MQLTLSKSIIRSFHKDDAALIAGHLEDYAVARNMSALPQPYSLVHAAHWIDTATGKTPETHFAIAVDGKAAGGIGLDVGDSERLTVCDHCAEIGYWLGKPFWGRGIMSEAVAALTEWAFAELHVVRLHAAVYARNPASARILEKAGYEFEGRLRARYFRDSEFIDGLLYAKVRLPH